jgi:predicted transcriptional regulator YheO
VIVKEPAKGQNEDISQRNCRMKTIMRVVYKTPSAKEKKMNLDIRKNVEAFVSASIDKIIKDLEPKKTSEQEPQLTQAPESENVWMTTSSRQETEAVNSSNNETTFDIRHHVGGKLSAEGIFYLKGLLFLAGLMKIP